MGSGSIGTSMHFDVNPEREKRRRKAADRQQKRWAAKAGPVETVQAERCPTCSGWVWPDREHACPT